MLCHLVHCSSHCFQHLTMIPSLSYILQNSFRVSGVTLGIQISSQKASFRLHVRIPIFLSCPPTVVPFLLICCDCGGAPAGGAGFEPVPECSEGAIHPWAVEGPGPETGVSADLSERTGGGRPTSGFCACHPLLVPGSGAASAWASRKPGTSN